MKESKFDLVSAILAFCVCIGIAFFVTNLLINNLNPIEPVSFKTVKSAVSGKVGSPSEDIFNYTAINPTVEVCVGCVDESDIEPEDESDELEEEE